MTNDKFPVLIPESALNKLGAYFRAKLFPDFVFAWSENLSECTHYSSPEILNRTGSQLPLLARRGDRHILDTITVVPFEWPLAENPQVLLYW
jgi:hypothetical protein